MQTDNGPPHRRRETDPFTPWVPGRPTFPDLAG